MIKLSYYNHYLALDNSVVLIYNAFQGAYILLQGKVYNDLMLHKKDLFIFKNIYSQSYKQLYDNGVIIDSDVNEFDAVENLRLLRRFSPREYHVTINPTLNCNLACWYCYETHKPKSDMTNKVIDNLISLIKNQHIVMGYKILTLAFFGGEPMLKPNSISLILKQAKEFCDDNDIILKISFTTNGTCISPDILDLLKDFQVSFQITFDGDVQKHNEVRHFKRSMRGSYWKIIDTLKLIIKTLTDCSIILRVNYDEKTLDSLSTLLDDLDFLDRTRTVFSLHQVWQVDNSKINYIRIYDFIAKMNSRSFIVDYFSLRNVKSHLCYADNFNQIVVNYNGDVYKCTARDFSKKNREGVLCDLGTVLWDIGQVHNRMSSRTPLVCQKCKLYPACMSFCSQKLIENKLDDFECRITNFENINDLILINFNQYILNQKLKKL